MSDISVLSKQSLVVVSHHVSSQGCPGFILKASNDFGINFSKLLQVFQSLPVLKVLPEQRLISKFGLLQVMWAAELGEDK